MLIQVMATFHIEKLNNDSKGIEIIDDFFSQTVADRIQINGYSVTPVDWKIIQD